MYRLRVSSSFAAAHYLPNLHGHCQRMHGHTFQVEVEVSSRDLDVMPGGMLLDLEDLKADLEEVLLGLDHTVLNDLPQFRVVPPTAEMIATHIARKLQEEEMGGASLSAVTVWESPDAGVRFEV